MNRAVIVDAVRTPIGRSHPEKGYYRHIRSDDLAAQVVQSLLERTGIEASQVEDLVLGNTQQQGEQGFDVARTVALLAGLPVETGGATVNRLCGSSLQAINQAAHAVMCGMQDVQIVGGLEHMHHIPMDKGLDINKRLLSRTSRAAFNMGITAEFLAQTHGIDRNEQDNFAMRSHVQAAAAHAGGRFQREIIPTWGHNEQGEKTLFTADQCVRPEASMESLGALKPAFIPELGTVTAGNSSPLNDGASALLMMSEQKAKDLGLKPLVRVIATAVVGVDPCVMGTGPVPATKKVLEKRGMKLSDVQLIEINEAFAAQVLTCARMLHLDMEKVNPKGGAIAIGHPLGASGARIATTLIHTMVEQEANVGLATMCIGVGQGIATVFERV